MGVRQKTTPNAGSFETELLTRDVNLPSWHSGGDAMKISSVAKLFSLLSPLFLLVAACMTVSCARTGIGASKVPVDRTVLPIAESTNPSITELNVRKATLNGGSRRETVSSTGFRW